MDRNMRLCVVPIHGRMRTIKPGDFFWLQVRIMKIPSNTALACYGVNLKFEPSVIEFKEILFGDALYGNQLDLHGQGTIQRSLTDKAAVGSIGIVETSNLDMVSYIDLQRKDFTLAVVMFQAKNEGICTIQLEWGIEQLEGPNVGQGMGPGNLYGTTINVGESGANILNPPQDLSVNKK